MIVILLLMIVVPLIVLFGSAITLFAKGATWIIGKALGWKV